MLVMTQAGEPFPDDITMLKKLEKLGIPLFLLINKVDLVTPQIIAGTIKEWNKKIKFKETIPISALKNKNVDLLLELILKYLPEGPAYYPKDQLTDRPERFFVSEIIREKIFLLYKQEIPYSCLLYTSPSPRDATLSRMPSSA